MAGADLYDDGDAIAKQHSLFPILQLVVSACLVCFRVPQSTSKHVIGITVYQTTINACNSWVSERGRSSATVQQKSRHMLTELQTGCSVELISHRS